MASCIIGITGYSGSGKTTLIRKIIPELKKHGLAVGVLKHIHHKLNVDIRGKDTDHFYRAGADFVFAHDCRQGFARYRDNSVALLDFIQRFPPSLDLIIVEGHKDIDIPGIWLEVGTSIPKKSDGTGYGRRKIISRNDPEYLRKVLEYIHEELRKYNSERPVLAGLLIGGKSMRMGTDKALLKLHGRSLASKSFRILSAVSEKAILLGSGNLPASLHRAERLPDIAGSEGPMAGILSAFRWAPEVTWLISSVDMPFMNEEAWEWLLSQRKPGVWAVLPKIGGSRGVETTGAVYEPMIFEYMESMARDGIVTLQGLVKHPKVITPLIPKTIEHSWVNVNTPTDWSRALRFYAKR